MVDKPLAPTADQGRLRAAAARAWLLTVFQNRRWDGDFRTVQGLVEAGELGTVHRFESRFERWRPTPTRRREKGGADEAGGLLIDLGSHLIDQAIQLFGRRESVYAELDRRRVGVTVDDDAFVALKHDSGVRSHLWMSALAGQQGPRFRLLGSTGAYESFGLDGQEDALAAGGDPPLRVGGSSPRRAGARSPPAAVNDASRAAEGTTPPTTPASRRRSDRAARPPSIRGTRSTGCG